MEIVPQVAQAMQTLLTTVADRLGRESGFIQRQRKLTGSVFVQALVFGWLGQAQMRVGEMAQMAGALGVGITPQGWQERFTPAAARCLKGVLEAALGQVIAAQPVAIPILARFVGVYVLDSTTVALPDALAQEWAGCGGRTEAGTQAALKLQVRWDLASGQMEGPSLQAGQTSDQSSPWQTAPLPAGALRLADLGLFDLDVLADVQAQGSYWLTRLKAGTRLWQDGALLDVAASLQAAPGDQVDVPIALGQHHRLPARLVAQRVPAEVAETRRRKLHQAARKKGQTVSQTRLAWADWTVLVTNVPVETLPLAEVLVLARARWQIEMLFKLWKSVGQIDAWRSQNPWRILCEVYAKLIAMLVQHWVFLCGCWAYPDRSLGKAAQTLRQHALCLALALPSVTQLQAALQRIARCWQVGCRIHKQNTRTHTYQLLLQCTDQTLT